MRDGLLCCRFVGLVKHLLRQGALGLTLSMTESLMPLLSCSCAYCLTADSTAASLATCTGTTHKCEVHRWEHAC